VPDSALTVLVAVGVAALLVTFLLLLLAATAGPAL